MGEKRAKRCFPPHTCTNSIHDCLKQEQEMIKKERSSKEQMMSIAKQDCDGESQNTQRYLDN